MKLATEKASAQTLRQDAPGWTIWLTTCLGTFLAWNALQGIVEAQTGTASWYSNASAKRERTCHVGKRGGCLTASGKELNDQAYTAASWDYPFGTTLRVCLRPRSKPRSAHGRAGSCIETVVTDRGPAKRLYRQGRIIDLSKKSFEAVCGALEKGVCEVTIDLIPSL